MPGSGSGSRSCRVWSVGSVVAVLVIELPSLREFTANPRADGEGSSGVINIPAVYAAVFGLVS